MGGLVGASLAALGIVAGCCSIAGCSTLDAEFRVVRRAYFAKALATHPDKGGDAAAFRAANEAFEHLRSIYEDAAVASFVPFVLGSYPARNCAADTKDFFATTDVDATVHPFDFFCDAAQSDVPQFRIERAKSGRSLCTQRATKGRCTAAEISTRALRVGTMDLQAGKYGRWVHLECWRVPYSIWSIVDAALRQPQSKGSVTTAESRVAVALTRLNEVLFCGFRQLDADARANVVVHCMDPRNWARPAFGRASKSQSPQPAKSENGYEAETRTSVPSLSKLKSASELLPSRHDSFFDTTTHLARLRTSSAALVNDGAKNIVLSKVIDDANFDLLAGETTVARYHDAQALRDHTIVLTGTFAEVGGGAGLDLGKERLRAMCEARGARVTSAVSGRTTLLVVGAKPGITKVTKAREMQPRCRLISARDMLLCLRGDKHLDQCRDVQRVDGFSNGYNNNGRALGASGDELAFAMCGARRGRLYKSHTM